MPNSIFGWSLRRSPDFLAGFGEREGKEKRGQGKVERGRGRGGKKWEREEWEGLDVGAMKLRIDAPGNHNYMDCTYIASFSRYIFQEDDEAE